MKQHICRVLAALLTMVIIVSGVPLSFAEEQAVELIEAQPAAAPELVQEAPAAEPEPEPEPEPSEQPTEQPTAEPTAEPTVEPTAEPTAEPIVEPTAEPTAEPTVEPAVEPAGESLPQSAQELAARFGLELWELAEAFELSEEELLAMPAGEIAALYSQLLEMQGGAAVMAAGDFTIDSKGTLTKYTGTDKEVVIPNTVKSIGGWAFYNNDWIQSVVIPSGVKSIGNNAFYDCDNLEKVSIPGSVESIGGSAFSGCDRLKEVELGEGLEILYDSAFSSCPRLKSIALPNSLEEIGNSVFSGCSDLKGIKFGSKLEKIGSYAFESSGLKEITIPANLEVIPNEAFRNCDHLKSVTISNGVEKIGYDAFYDCDRLEKLSIPGSVESIGNYAFYHCDQLKEVELGEGLEILYDSAFYSCTSLTDVYLPKSLEEIGSYAFSGCKNATYWVYPDSYALTYCQQQGLNYKIRSASTPTPTPTPTPTATPAPTPAYRISYTSHANRSEVTAGDTIAIRWQAGRSSSYIANAKLLDGAPVPGNENEAGKSLIARDTRLHTSSLSLAVPDAAGKYIKLFVYGEDASGRLTEGGEALYLKIVEPQIPDHDCYAYCDEPAVCAECGKAYSGSELYHSEEVTLQKLNAGMHAACCAVCGEVQYQEEHSFEDGVCACGQIRAVLEISGKDVLTVKKSATLTVKDASGTKLNNKNLRWTSSNKSIASVSSKGVVAGKKAGTATITATAKDGSCGSFDIEVVPAAQKLTLYLDGQALKSGAAITLDRGESVALSAVVSPEGAEQEVKWSSSSSKTVSVTSDGLVEALKKNTKGITITAKTANGKKATVKIKVIDPNEPTGVVLEESGTLTLKMYDSLQLHASVKPDTADDTLAWSSSNTKYARVDENGLVTPVKYGKTVTITVKTYNGKSDKVKVKIVNAPKPEQPKPEEPKPVGVLSFTGYADGSTTQVDIAGLQDLLSVSWNAENAVSYSYKALLMDHAPTGSNDSEAALWIIEEKNVAKTSFSFDPEWIEAGLYLKLAVQAHGADGSASNYPWVAFKLVDRSQAAPVVIDDYSNGEVTKLRLGELNGDLTLSWKAENAVRYSYKAILMDTKPTGAQNESLNASKVFCNVTDATIDENSITIQKSDLQAGKYLKLAVVAYGSNGNDSGWTWIGLEIVDKIVPAINADELTKTAANIIFGNEGGYGSVSNDISSEDNSPSGPSVGRLQWHNDRALNLLKSIINRNAAKAKSILGENLYNEITNQKTVWNKNRWLNDNEKSVLKQLLTTDEGKSVQDEQAYKDVEVYLNAGKGVGLKDPQALVFFADLYNLGPAYALKVAQSAAKEAGSMEAVTLEHIYQAARQDKVFGVNMYEKRLKNTYDKCNNIVLEDSGDGGTEQQPVGSLKPVKITNYVHGMVHDLILPQLPGDAYIGWSAEGADHYKYKVILMDTKPQGTSDESAGATILFEREDRETGVNIPKNKLVVGKYLKIAVAACDANGNDSGWVWIGLAIVDKIVPGGNAELSEKRKAAIAFAYSWLEEEWELPCDLKLHRGGITLKAKTVVRGIPYNLCKFGYKAKDDTDEGRGSVLTNYEDYKENSKDFTSTTYIAAPGQTSKGVYTPKHGADCIQLVYGAWKYADKKTTYRDYWINNPKEIEKSIDWKEAQPGDALYRSSINDYVHCRLIVAIDDSGTPGVVEDDKFTCIEQTSDGLGDQITYNGKSYTMIGTRLKTFDYATLKKGGYCVWRNCLLDE